MEKIYQLRAPRYDIFDVRQGNLSAREYLSTEHAILNALRGFFRTRQVVAIDGGLNDKSTGRINAHAPARITADKLSSELGKPLNLKGAMFMMRSVMRSYFWTYFVVDKTKGIYVYEGMSLFFCGLTLQDKRDLETFGVELDGRSDRAEDETLTPEYYCSLQR